MSNIPIVLCRDRKTATIEWISVNDALPRPYEENVLISYIEDGKPVVDFGFIRNDGKFVSHTVKDSRNACSVVEGITRWARVAPPED